MKVETTWKYWVDDGVDGKPTGWYAWEQAAASNLEGLFRTWLLGSSEVVFESIQSGHFSYDVDFSKMRQRNTTSGKERLLRRCISDPLFLSSMKGKCTDGYVWQTREDGSFVCAGGGHTLSAEQAAKLVQDD